MRHTMATFFLFLAHKLDPLWIQGILRVSADTHTPAKEPEQTPDSLPPSQYNPENVGVDMIAEGRHFPPSVFDTPPED